MLMQDTKHETEAEEAQSHYRTAGRNLILLGVINACVAAGYIWANAGEAFIAFDMMALFSVAFIAVGVWMRSYTVTETD